MEMTLPEFKEIREELADNRELFQFAMTVCAPKLTITVNEIAHKEGVAQSSLRAGGACQYLLPRFGESAYPDGPKRWDIAEYHRWRKIPAEERKRMWKEHLRNEKNRRKDSHISRA